MAPVSHHLTDTFQSRNIIGYRNGFDSYLRTSSKERSLVPETTINLWDNNAGSIDSSGVTLTTDASPSVFALSFLLNE